MLAILSPNGRRAWRKWATRRRRLFRRLCRDLRSGAHTKVTPTPYDAPIKRRVRKSSEGRGLRGPRATPPRPFTPRSLVGMSQKARKRLRHDRLFGPNVAPTKLLLADSLTVQLHIGERLRPCPGCCACWGHRISSAYGEIAECCGPQTSGKRKSQIKAMRKWQETLADNCDGSGVLPARRP